MWCALALTFLLSAPQNRDHPGLVHLGDGEWGTPAQAAEKGMVRHQGQWFPKERAKDLRKWEREDAKGLAWEDAYRTKSEHYRIETNVPRWRVELEIKPFLDALFETYVRVFAEDFGLSGKAAGNKDIRIYDGFEAYSVNEPDEGKPRPRTNPGFIVDGSLLVVYYDDTDPGTFYMSCFHEGAHQFFLSLLPGASPPHWLSEALATYFEGCTYSRATNAITPGFVPAERLAVAQGILGNGKPATAEELFLDVPRERFQGTEYALSWSFVHYLVNRPGAGSRAGFARFVRATNGAGAKPAAEIFADTNGEELAALLPGWRAHVLALPPPDPIYWVALQVHKAAPEEDLRSMDLVWSFDGVEVFSAKQFQSLWKARPAERPIEVVVVRVEPGLGDPNSTRRFVRVTIPAGSPIVLRGQGELERRDGLRD
jgi:uncharacterized protein DUF1570